MSKAQKKQVIIVKKNKKKSRKNSRVIQLLLQRCPVPSYLRRSSPFPDRKVASLNYVAHDVLQDSVNSWTYIDFVINDFYNFFPTLITPGKALGYASLTKIYSQNVVAKIQFQITFVSNEPAHGVSGFVSFSDSQPTPSTLDELLEFAARTPGTPVLTVGQTTGASEKESVMVEFEIPAVTGNIITYVGEQGFVGTPGVSPAQKVYGVIGVFNPIGTALTNGLDFVLEARLTGVFYSLANDY